MSKTYIVSFVVVAPEGFKDQFDPYPFDDVFDAQGAEVFNTSIETLSEEAE